MMFKLEFENTFGSQEYKFCKSFEVINNRIYIHHDKYDEQLHKFGPVRVTSHSVA